MRVLHHIFGAATVAAGFSGPAVADFVGTFSGNDCAGVYGTPPNCVVPAQDGIPNATALIAKLSPNGTVQEVGLFPSIDGTEFSFDFGDDGNTGTGTWFYNPGPGDPLITAYVAKGGPGFNLFSNPGTPNSNDFFTPENPGGNTPALSHITFYDSAAVVPIPAAAWLFGSALVGMAGVGYRRSRKQSA